LRQPPARPTNRGSMRRLALDAMTDIRDVAHEFNIGNVFPRLGETGSTQEIISLLERRSSAL
jgi:hypothetical protein